MNLQSACSRMQSRQEWKYEINYGDFLMLKARLGAVMMMDIHAREGEYQVRSLYFDNFANKVLQEKRNGLAQREKFRIRYYNGDTTFIRLEKKEKDGNFSRKETLGLTLAEAKDLLAGKTAWLLEKGEDLPREFYAKMQYQNLRPKMILEYCRVPYTFQPGNVRITLDYHLRVGMEPEHFFCQDCVTVPVRDNPIILEIKWDTFLPDIIRDAVDLPARRAGNFSKYVSGRQYE